MSLDSPTPPELGELAAVNFFNLELPWRSEGNRGSAMYIDERTMPLYLNTTNSSGLFSVVSQDKLSVEYVGKPLHGHDVGAVQANCPAPTGRPVYYFEMTVINAGKKGRISIGFTGNDFKMHRQPGWEANSCGYHGDDGHIYQGQGKGKPFGPTFTTNDVVGAGINYITNEFFFTKNANVVGTVPNDIRGSLFPTIAVHNQNEKVTVNFGKKPFLFDVEVFIFEWPKMLFSNDAMQQTNISHWIVRSYFLHYGYQDTLNSFDSLSEIMRPGSSIQNNFDGHNSYAFNHRSKLHQLIKNGDIDSAMQRLHEWYPKLLQEGTSYLCFLLHSHRFIEYIRDSDLKNAIEYSRVHLAKFFSIDDYVSTTQDLAGLLAYKEPRLSPVGYLLDLSRREHVADVANLFVLSTNPCSTEPQSRIFSALEWLLKQLTLCTWEVISINSLFSLPFYLHKELHRSRRGKST